MTDEIEVEMHGEPVHGETKYAAELPEGSTIIEGEAKTRTFHRLQLIHAMAMEISTGINIRPVRSLVEHARRCGYLGERHGNIKTKQSALRAMVREYKEKVDPNYEPNERIVKAIGDGK